MKNTLFALMTILLALSLLACNKKACERSCDCQMEEDADADELDECVENCEKVLDKEKDDCQDAFRHYARCLDRHNCASGACALEMEEFSEECDEISAPTPGPQPDPRLPDWYEADGDEEEEDTE